MEAEGVKHGFLLRQEKTAHCRGDGICSISLLFSMGWEHGVAGCGLSYLPLKLTSYIFFALKQGCCHFIFSHLRSAGDRDGWHMG